jgi:small-conductance mechanosensitive channel
MDIQQSINLRLHRELNELGVELAYPTQKLYVVAQELPRDREERPDKRRGERQEGALGVVRSK